MPSRSVRQRKLIQHDDDDYKQTRPKRKNVTRTSQSNLKYSFLALTISAILLVLVLGVYTDSFHPIFDGIALKLGYKENQYAIIIDAGSTGSRVLAYQFHKGYLDGRLVLDSELFKETKPGLSSYVDNPEKGAKSIDLLLDDAKKFVPNELWHSTPLSLKATAGLRLLDSDKADNLLNSVREVFLNSGFQIRDDSVEIMDGTDEGIFSWFTLNFLLGRLNGQNTVAALDLGGGSTQVTFVPKIAQQSSVLAEYIHSVPLLNGNVNVFTNSYLGLGIQIVRYSVFSDGYPKNDTVFVSECVNPIVKRNLWKYANVEYAISGKDNVKSTMDNPVVDFDVCQNKIKKIISPLVIPKPISLKQNQISAFSYYFERAIETGLVDPFEGGDILVGDFMKKAREICAIPNTDQPFMCLDILYIAILLEDGFGLKPQTPIKLTKKIDGHEISWALGCAYNLLTAQK